MIRARLGDWVELELKSISILKASTIRYACTPIALIIGVVVGYALADNYPKILNYTEQLRYNTYNTRKYKGSRPLLNKKGDYTQDDINYVCLRKGKWKMASDVVVLDSNNFEQEQN